MSVGALVKTGLLLKKYWKHILVVLFIAITLILMIPVLLMAAFLPGGEDEDIQKYIQVGNELSISWQDLITLDMVKYNNELVGRDPNDSAKHFIELRYEEFEPARYDCTEVKDGECIGFEHIPEKVTYSETAKGYSQVKAFLRGMSSKSSIKAIIDSINSSNSRRVTLIQLTAEEAMADANFTKKQIEEFYDIQKSGVFQELYPEHQYMGLIPGACVNNVSPDGKAKANATVQAYTATIKKYADRYGIGQYTEIIKSMMMAESGGKGNDPMQASESGSANIISSCKGKFGAARIGCITNPEDSIHVGVLEFKSVIQHANYDIAIALQTYNFGPYFATWIKENGGKYSVEVAQLYSSTIMANAGQGLGTPTHAQKILTQYYEHPGCTAGSISPEMIGANNWVWPTKSTRVTDTFISTADFRYGEVHGAVDIGAVRPGVAGDQVWSMADGVVIQVGPITGGGRSVFVQHDNNVISRYIHLQAYNVNVGQKVTKGQVIGVMGGSGGTRTTIIDNAYAVHLDFQIKVNGEPVDPLQFFPNIR
ncbi:lysozyme family protein [Cytobacillus gottheilii]|uniref:Lysozyme family protein n=1 Tax=Cytobacillus gottheilii TaxID=859144 RepID=A0ABX8FIW2_9BACI|nr:lysozyme family protein [Cytobacillus gottheilii]QVY63951.1 lysozyme family protein [Cytobacillus gottheilii]